MFRIKHQNKDLFSLLLIVIAILSRFIPHPPNFTPITAIALFAGFSFNNKVVSFLVPLIAMLVSDFFIGFHSTMWAVYLSFILIVTFGFILRNRFKFGRLFSLILLSSFSFYIITNFAVWLTSGMYPLNFEGLVQCYTMGLPFYNTSTVGMLGFSLLGDIFYSFVIFGAYKLAENKLIESNTKTSLYN